MTWGDGVDLAGTLVRDERGMKLAIKIQNADEKSLSTTLVGDEVVLRVGMRGGRADSPVENTR